MLKKTNPQNFWNYIKSKTTCRGTIGDIKITRNGTEVNISDDIEKAEVF